MLWRWDDKYREAWNRLLQETVQGEDEVRRYTRSIKDGGIAYRNLMVPDTSGLKKKMIQATLKEEARTEI